MKGQTYFMRLLIIGTVTIATPGANSTMYDSVADFVCYFKNECCREPAIRNANATMTVLRNMMTDRLFGQHIAMETALVALEAHLNNASPDKPLVLSFHGWSGSGKTFLARMIVDSLFVKGQQSAYFKYFAASSDFFDHKQVSLYKAQLKTAIESTLTACERSVFVFDEVNRMPLTLLDSLAVFLDRVNVLEGGVNQKKAIYILLSNIGAQGINEKSLDQWKMGRPRGELTFLDFEQIVSAEAFKTAGNGLHKAIIIQRHLIGYYVPFLPLERRHVMGCIRTELKAQNYQIRSTVLEQIADSLEYWPKDLQVYSTSGCQHVEERVTFLTRTNRNKNKEL